MAKILIVDDNLDMLDTLEHLFTFYEHEVVKAVNGKEALSMAEKEHPSLIILDALMPVMNGFEACEHLKKNPKTSRIPVIFLSANYTEDEHRQRGLNLGADDYILKPFNAKELIAKVESALKRKVVFEKLRLDNQELIKKDAHYHQTSNELKLHSLENAQPQDATDTLTGLYNDSFFQSFYSQQYSRSINDNFALSLALIDVDFFQKITAICGDQVGDFILVKIANVILNNTRSSEMVFRLDLNRFGLVFPDTPEARAFYEAERIRTAIFQTQFFKQESFELRQLSSKRREQLQTITVSIGITTLSKNVAMQEFYRQAEIALSKAKAKGHNATLRYSELVKELEKN